MHALTFLLLSALTHRDDLPENLGKAIEDSLGVGVHSSNTFFLTCFLIIFLKTTYFIGAWNLFSMVDILECHGHLVEARNRNILGWSGAVGKLSEDPVVKKISNLFYTGGESALFSERKESL